MGISSVDVLEQRCTQRIILAKSNADSDEEDDEAQKPTDESADVLFQESDAVGGEL